MKRKNKPVTKNMLRKYFGKDATIRGFWGDYRVTTPMGGKVVITPDKIKLVYGGDDVYRAVLLLIGECWGSAKAGPGSREFMLASVAHGEAWGVNIQPNFRDRWATFARWCAAIVVFWIGCMMGADDSAAGAWLALAAAVAVFWLMKLKARAEEQRKLETGGFHFPRQHGGADYADDDECRKGGLM
jgi:hypothetical protein